MSNIITITPWFSGDEKPMADRPGLYERDYSYLFGGLNYDGGKNYILWCWWDGEFFGNGADFTHAKNFYDSHGKSDIQNLPWRGVMK